MPTTTPAFAITTTNFASHLRLFSICLECKFQVLKILGSSLKIQTVCVCVYIYIYIYFFFFFSENTLGECRINILIKKGERERRLERGKNDHRNPARNRTRDLSLSGRLLYQSSYWARSDSDQITEPPSPSPAERMKER